MTEKRFSFRIDPAVPDDMMIAMCHGKIVQVIRSVQYALMTAADIEAWPQGTEVHVSRFIADLMRAANPETAKGILEPEV